MTSVKPIKTLLGRAKIGKKCGFLALANGLRLRLVSHETRELGARQEADQVESGEDGLL